MDLFKKIDLKKYDAKWFELNEVPEIILDHNQMINYAVSKLREIAKTKPL